MKARSAGYVGRFAPSPTGPLHAGSMVAALASWLDARAHGGRWLVRIEDVDLPRCVAGADQRILSQLAAVGLIGDEAPVWQSSRGSLHQRALDALTGAGWAYSCGCTRKDIEVALAALHGRARTRHGEVVYPGTCRPERGGSGHKTARAVRVRTAAVGTGADIVIDWADRRLGAQTQNITDSIGDFVLRRADGLWAYQLAVVVDDAAQNVTSVVRGEDLADNTARQIHLQTLLGLPLPCYLHTPLVVGANGEKLSKQNGAQAVEMADLGRALEVLRDAGHVLGLRLQGPTIGEMLASGVAQWAQAYKLA